MKKKNNNNNKNSDEVTSNRSFYLLGRSKMTGRLIGWYCKLHVLALMKIVCPSLVIPYPNIRSVHSFISVFNTKDIVRLCAHIMYYLSAAPQG